MNISFRIALRYFFSRKKGGSFNLISVISAISLMGYIAGAAALVIVLSVFNGFEHLFVSMYNNFDADLQISASGGKTFDSALVDFRSLQRINGVKQMAVVLEENVLLRYGDKQCLATAKGIDKNFLQMTTLDSCMVRGDALVEENHMDYALAGQGIAYQLSLDPDDLFNRLVFYVPDRHASNSIDMSGSFKQDALYPSGVFSVQQEVDEKFVLVPLAFLRGLLDKPNALSSIEISLTKEANEDEVKTQLSALFPEGKFTIKNRFQQREAFFKVMRSEKMISYFILFFILLIAASNTIGSLFILVIGKKQDIHMLGSMGMPGKQVALIFIMEGILQALSGGIVGILIGLGLCYLQENFALISLNSAAAEMFRAYPVKVHLADLFLVGITLLVLGIITSIYPAYRANKMLSPIK